MAIQNIYLLKQLVRKDIRTRYTGSVLGFVWAFAQPVLQLLLFTFVFSTVMKIPLTGERGIESFSLFLFAGLLPWMAINESLVRGTTVIQDHASMIQKVRLSPLVLVLSIVVSSMVHEIFALTMFMAILVFTGNMQFTWLGLPALLLLQLIVIIGPVIFLASMQVFFRDTIQFVHYLTMVWFYFTPIVYPLSLVQGGVVSGGIPSWILTALRWNPLTVIVEAYRDFLLRGSIPDLLPIFMLTGASIVLGYVALRIFTHLRSQFADLV